MAEGPSSLAPACPLLLLLLLLALLLLTLLLLPPPLQAPGSLSAVMSPSGSAGGYQGPGRRSSKTMESLGMQPEQRRGTADMNAYDMARR